MAIFKVPRITTTQRLTTTLELAELVFDTDEKKFYGGNGITAGGNELGSGGFQNQETIVLNNSDILNKSIVLNSIPKFPTTVQLIPVGGIPQINGIDFIVNGQLLRWDGFGLDNFLEIGDILIVQY